MTAPHADHAGTDHAGTDHAGTDPAGTDGHGTDGVSDPVTSVSRRLFDLAERGGGRRPYVMAVDGPSGSGKSTLADQLVAHLDALGGAAVVVRLDDLYPGWGGLDAVVPLLVERVLAPLAGTDDDPVTAPGWDWDRAAPGPARLFAALGPPRPRFVVLEGAGAGARACSPYLAGLLWVEAAADVRRRRALDRDGAPYAPHWDAWAAQERAHFARERTRERADLVLDTTKAEVTPVETAACHRGGVVGGGRSR